MASLDSASEVTKVEADENETGTEDVKSSQMDLIPAMLAGIREEMERDRQEVVRAREEQTRVQAEQAQVQDELQAQMRAEQARHLVEVVQASQASLRTKTQHYADQLCESLAEVQSLRSEVEGLKKEVQHQK